MSTANIEGHLKSVLIQWIIIIGAAWLFGRLSRRVGQPPAVGEIFAGILLGPTALGKIWPDTIPPLFPTSTQQSLQLLGKLGLIVFLFQVGMELNIHHLRSRSRTVLLVSIFGIVVPMVGGLILGPWLHRSFASSVPYWGCVLFVSISLSITALPVMGRILMELGLERTPLGVLGISAAAVDDAIGWVMLTVVAAVFTSGFKLGSLLVQVIGITVFCWITFAYVGPGLISLWKKMVAASEEDSEQDLTPGTTFLATIIVALFLCCLATNVLGLLSIFGAFVLGASLHSDARLVKWWRHKFADLTLIALVPLYFANTGLRTDIGTLSSPLHWVGLGALVAVAVFSKFGGCWFGARITGQSNTMSICIGALMNARGLMGLIAIDIGRELGYLSPELFTMLVFTALITTAMTVPILNRFTPGLPEAQPDTTAVRVT